MSTIEFNDLQNQLLTLFGKENLDQVERHILKAEKMFPDRLDKTAFWKACLYTIQNKKTLAIEALQDGLNKGFWWNPDTLTRDPDLTSLQNDDDFKAIVHSCKKILEKENPRATSKLYAKGNQQAEIGIYSMHWRGSNVEDFAPFWLNEQLLTDYYFGFPQSSQIYGYNSYCWDNEEIALQDITKTLKEFPENKRIILAGASQGGKLAIEMSLLNIVDNVGFIAVVPSIKDLSGFEEILERIQYTSVKGCIVTGTCDPFYKKTLELTKLLKTHKIPLKIIIKKGLGHYFPNDFTAISQKAITYLSNPTKRSSESGGTKI